MTLNQLIFRAASVYPEAAQSRLGDPVWRVFKPAADPGDALAAFILRELSETFDAGGDEDAQIAVAVSVMQHASDRLADVAHALSTMSLEERIAA